MTDQQLPDRNGDVIDDIVIALTRRGDLSPEHRAFYESILDRFEALTSERDRLRTAWESARRGRAQAYRQLDDARRWGRILEAQRADLRREVRAESAQVSAARDERDQALRAAREATGRLPEEDMVEPGDEVPALAELADRLGSVEARLDAIEERLSPPETQDAAPVTNGSAATGLPEYMTVTGPGWHCRRCDMTRTTAPEPSHEYAVGHVRAVHTPVADETAGGAE